MASLPDDAEGALTLCAAVESLTEPVTAFIRLAESKGGFKLESTVNFFFPYRIKGWKWYFVTKIVLIYCEKKLF